MNTTSLLHLAWKEYRFARGFWLAMVGLVVAAQAFVVWWSRIEQFSDAWIALVVCNLALGAPVFFALGCAGATFAVEREEGTYDFLRAAPLSPAQVFGTKLGLTAAATVAMFVLLWPVALWFTRGHVPEAPILSGMLGFWLLAAVEAIAWGTLFSLLSARPLVAVCLALVAASTVTHLFGMSMSEGAHYEFQFAHYLQAALWRGLIVALLLAADVYLGLRWLDEGQRVAKPTRRKFAAEKPLESQALAARADRSTLFGHLLWQHFRQSGRMTLLMGGLQIALVWLAKCGIVVAGSEENLLPIVPLVGMAAVMGSCVFLADQERRHFRFFVEHNVPPRYVWLSRQVAWIGAMVVFWLVACLLWIGPDHLIFFVRVLLTLNAGPELDWRLRQIGPVTAGAVVSIFWIALCYAAGQWTSMFVRSGLLAAVLGIFLAGLLSGWSLLMFFLPVSLLWSVAPLLVVFLWATWLRAPDWVRENTSWLARGKAAAAVLVPIATLCILVPYYRVHQIPLESPGFDVAQYESQIPSDGRETAALYRRANELFVSTGDANEVGLLEQNTEPLHLLLEASGRPHCLLNDPRQSDDSPQLYHAAGLISLLIASGQQLQAEGKLDEAFDRYLAALRVISQWSENNATQFSVFSYSSANLLAHVLDEIPKWAAAQGQTVERIRGAFDRINQLNLDRLHCDDRLKAAYLVARRLIMGDHAAAQTLLADHPSLAAMFLYQKLLPWEKHREQRSLNLYTRDALNSLALAETHLAQGVGILNETPVEHAHFYYPWDAETLFRIAPAMAYFRLMAVSELAKFETWRRATLLLLALEAYRLEHGELPPSLDALVGPYFAKLPRDPYSGYDFVYFRNGLPQPSTELEAAELKDLRRRQPIEPGVPCIWSTSSQLFTGIWQPDEPEQVVGKGDASAPLEKPILTYLKRYGNQVAPNYETWALGHWFPIPAAPKKSP